MRNLFLAVLAMVMAGAILAPAGAGAQATQGNPAEEYSVRIARLKYGGGGDWYTGPSTVPNWLTEFERRTGVKTFKDEKVVTLTEENLRAYPFLYMTGHGTIKLTGEERDALRAYLEDGGFLFANDSYGLDASLRAMVKELFPERPFEEISADHPIFHCYYDLPGLPKIHKHDEKPPQAFGVSIEGRLVIFYVYESDIGDGLEDPDVHHDPPAKQEEAMKMATNILMFALTQSVFL
jgi:hypothetical protein